jgi:hypothetical protein
MINYLDIDNYVVTLVKVSMSSHSSTKLPLWLWDRIAVWQGMVPKGYIGTTRGVRPSIRDVVDDGEAENMVEAYDFNSSCNRPLHSYYDWGGMQEVKIYIWLEIVGDVYKP